MRKVGSASLYLSRHPVGGCFPWPRTWQAAPSSPPRSALDADAGEQFLGGLDVGVLFAPVFGEVAAEGCGQDGFAQAVDQGGDAVEVLFGFAGALEQLFNLVDDTALLVDIWSNERNAVT
ncbi:MAG: hypothetical protein R3C68_08840 [Myxococcota bacterium]